MLYYVFTSHIGFADTTGFCATKRTPLKGPKSTVGRENACFTNKNKFKIKDFVQRIFNMITGHFFKIIIIVILNFPLTPLTLVIPHLFA